MVSQGVRSTPPRVNSSVSFGQGPDERFIASRAAYSTTLMQKTRVSSMLASESLPRARSGLRPVEANITCGGV